MRTKKILVIVLSCVLLLAVCVGATYALWGKNISADKETGASSGDWNEFEKYLTFSPVFREGTDQQIGWSVTGFKLSAPEKLKIPASLKENANSATYNVIEISGKFSNISGIIEVTLPKTITKINANAFTLFSDLQRVKIEAGATLTIGDTAFNACDQLVEFNYVGSVITSLGVDAFRGCVKLDNIPTVREG